MTNVPRDAPDFGSGKSGIRPFL